jgi:hypothetical protein
MDTQFFTPDGTLLNRDIRNGFAFVKFPLALGSGNQVLIQCGGGKFFDNNLDTYNRYDLVYPLDEAGPILPAANRVLWNYHIYPTDSPLYRQAGKDGYCIDAHSVNKSLAVIARDQSIFEDKPGFTLEGWLIPITLSVGAYLFVQTDNSMSTSSRFSCFIDTAGQFNVVPDINGGFTSSAMGFQVGVPLHFIISMYLDTIKVWANGVARIMTSFGSVPNYTRLCNTPSPMYLGGGDLLGDPYPLQMKMQDFRWKLGSNAIMSNAEALEIYSLSSDPANMWTITLTEDRSMRYLARTRVVTTKRQSLS